MTIHAISTAGTADRAAIAATLARAFASDPAIAFIFPDPADRAKRLPSLFGLLFDDDARGMRLVSTGHEAATLWCGPGDARTGLWHKLWRGWPMWRALGPNLARAMAVGDAIDAHLPHDDFWYLHIAGCDPAAQGRGLGAAVVRAGLQRVAGRFPTYLETATERNLDFYRNLGFAVTGEWHVPKGGPRFWSMLRAPDCVAGFTTPPPPVTAPLCPQSSPSRLV